MTITELIDRYELTLITTGDKAGNVAVRRGDLVKKDNCLDELKTRKPEVVKELQARIDAAKTAADDRRRKIDAIDGLKELENAISDWEEYHDLCNKVFESECGRMPAQPKDSISGLKARYPRATAYLKAKSYLYAHNYQKSAAGEKALARIINSENHETVIAEMEAEWSAAAHEATQAQ